MPGNLVHGSPESGGLRSGPIEAARARLRAMQRIPDGATHPLFPGVVAVAGYGGAVVAREVSGHAYLHERPDAPAPESRRIPMETGTLFDLASLTKLFTALAAVQLVEEGSLLLGDRVSRYLPGFEAGGKSGVTVRMLLTHTTGLPATLPLWSQWPTRQARLRAVLEARPTGPAGVTHLYSDLNLMALGMIVEKLRAAPLDQVVHRHITEPLGMEHTGYNPLTWPVAREGIAATEWQEDTGRGLVWGEVHDENAWALGGVAGHAGMFSTADDLAILCQMLLDGGRHRDARILTPESVEQLTAHVPQAPGGHHSLGFEVNQRRYMGALAGPRAVGHTGYTGTSLVIDFATRSFAILLTNRVHPVRTSGDVDAARRAWADGLARAMSR